MECNTFEELLYSDLLIADSMEKNNLKCYELLFFKKVKMKSHHSFFFSDKL